MPTGDSPRPGLATRLGQWVQADPTRRKCSLGLLVGLAVSVLVTVAWSFGKLEDAELWTLDLRSRLFRAENGGDTRLVLIQVDDESTDHLRATGQAWPPRREIWGQVVDYCRRGGARAVVLDLTFAEPSSYTLFARDTGWEGETDDEIFAGQVKRAGNVYIGATLARSDRAGAYGSRSEPPPLPFEIEIDRTATALPQYAGIIPPTSPIDAAPLALGNVVTSTDPDGVVRSYQPVVSVSGKPFPSLGILAAACLMGAERLRIEGRHLRIGDRSVRLDEKGRINLRFHGPWTRGARGNPTKRPYPYVPLKLVLESIRADALNEDRPEPERQPVPFPPEAFRDKVVFLGYTAVDLGDLHAMPIGPQSPGVLLHMTAADNLLNGDPILHSYAWATIVGIFLAGLLPGWIVSYASSWRGPTLGLLLVGVLVGAALLLYGKFRLWIDAAPFALAMIATSTLCFAVHYVQEYRQRKKIRGMLSVYLAPQAVAYFERHPEKLVLGGETKDATMFFSDLAGFTSISEGLGPAKLVEIMNDYLGRVTDVILRHEGTVDKYIGDAVVAFWNAPLDQPDHALRACNAALDSQKALEELRRQYPMLNMRVGLNTGLVTVGNMGCAAKFNYTVMGDAVNLASRLEGANKNYHTLTMIGEETHRLVAGRFVTRELDRLRVKGKDQPVGVYELLARAGELPDRKRQVLLRYEKGRVAYCERRWAEAIQHFQSARDLDPEDGPALVYLERCHEYLVHPPASDWDGVTTLTTK